MMKYYRASSLSLGVIFAAVGIIFVTSPDGVLRFFNCLSPVFSLRPAPLTGYNFYLILAASYMYMVSLLAFMMYRHPDNREFPLLLLNAKLASSIVSIALFVFQARFLIYAVNFVTDGSIALLVYLFYARLMKTRTWASS